MVGRKVAAGRRWNVAVAGDVAVASVLDDTPHLRATVLGVIKNICSWDASKDYTEKIDFQDIFIAFVNWPISELYGGFVCIMHYLDQSATG